MGVSQVGRPYGAFIVHPPVLVVLALAIQSAPVPAELKFVFVLAGGVAGSFWLAALATRVRPIARIVGARQLPASSAALSPARSADPKTTRFRVAT
jgi:hypothetical protein